MTTRYEKARQKRLFHFLLNCKNLGVTDPDTADILACFIVYERSRSKKDIGFTKLPFTRRQFAALLKSGGMQQDLREIARKLDFWTH